MRQAQSRGNYVLRTGATLASAALIGELLTGCSSSFDAHDADYSDWDKGPAAFLQYMAGHHAVEVCTGSSGLRADGHVRRTPEVDNNDDSDNSLKGFNNNRGQYRIVGPEKIQMHNSGEDGVSHTWYVTAMSNGQLAFVNKDAVVSSTAFHCQPATNPDQPGKIIKVVATGS